MGGVNHTDNVRGKSYRQFEGQIFPGDFGGVNCTDDLRGKSSLAISGGVNRPTFFHMLIVFILLPNILIKS